MPMRKLESFQRAKLPGTKGNSMLKLTDKKRMELRRLAQRPDSEIDLTDIPEIRDLPSDAVIGRFYRSNKEGVTMRLDADRS